jgi:hypothetical protein
MEGVPGLVAIPIFQECGDALYHDYGFYTTGVGGYFEKS